MSRYGPSVRPLGGPLLSLLLALFTLVCALVFVFASGIVAVSAIGDDELRALVWWFAGEDIATRALVAVGAAAAGVGSGALFVIRLRSGGVSGLYHVISADQDGALLIDRGGMAHLAEIAALRAPGVVEADARILGAERGPVRARLTVTVTPAAADLKASGEQVRARARTAIEECAGVGVTDVVVAMKVAPADYFERGLQ